MPNVWGVQHRGKCDTGDHGGPHRLCAAIWQPRWAWQLRHAGFWRVGQAGQVDPVGQEAQAVPAAALVAAWVAGPRRCCSCQHELYRDDHRAFGIVNHRKNRAGKVVDDQHCRGDQRVSPGLDHTGTTSPAVLRQHERSHGRRPGRRTLRGYRLERHNDHDLYSRKIDPIGRGRAAHSRLCHFTVISLPYDQTRMGIVVTLLLSRYGYIHEGHMDVSVQHVCAVVAVRPRARYARAGIAPAFHVFQPARKDLLS